MEKRVLMRCSVGEGERKGELITTEEVKIKDISAGGICLETSQYLNAKKSFKVEITSADNEKITLTCAVAWSSLMLTVEKKEGALSIYEVGLKFVDLNDAEKQFLEKYIGELAK